jgi:hypothetical protein
MSRLLEYRCADAVNRDLAARWLARGGGDPTDDPAAAAAVLIDHDHLPFGCTWAEVLPGPPSRPTAVHGYAIPREVRRACRRWGVRLARRLTPRLLRKLLPAACRRPAHRSTP